MKETQQTLEEKLRVLVVQHKTSSPEWQKVYERVIKKYTSKYHALTGRTYNWHIEGVRSIQQIREGDDFAI